MRVLTMADYSTAVEKSSGFYVVLVGGACGKPCSEMTWTVPNALDSWRSPVNNYGTVDADAELALTDSLRVRYLPTTLLYRDGVLVAQTRGALSENNLSDWIERNSL